MFLQDGRVHVLSYNDDGISMEGLSALSDNEYPEKCKSRACTSMVTGVFDVWKDAGGGA
jgi:hypothetical protein